MNSGKKEYKDLLFKIKSSPLKTGLKEEIKNSSCTSKQKRKLLFKYFWYRIVRRKYTERAIRKNLSECFKEDSYYKESCISHPLVSVIVPNYNHAAFLRQRIESILNQSFQDFELILLDDCSTDDSKEILLSYCENPKVSHVVINEENTGNTFLQWEKGVQLSKGQFIWIAESDDYAAPELLSSLVPHLLRMSEASFVYVGSYWVDVKGFVLPEGLDLWPDTGEVHYYKGKTFARHNLLYFNGVYNASMVVFRKSMFQKIEKKFVGMRYAGDWLCWFEMAMQGMVIEVQRKQNYFRQHNNKVTSRSMKNYGGVFDSIYIGKVVTEKLCMSFYMREMLRGYIYNHIRGIARCEVDERMLLDKLEVVLGGVKRSYILFRVNKFLQKKLHIPFLSMPLYDKLNSKRFC